MRHDIVPGATFPDYELPDHTTKHRKLSELQGDDPMVLVLSRGGYCPKERRQHEGLVLLVTFCNFFGDAVDVISGQLYFHSGYSPVLFGSIFHQISSAHSREVNLSQCFPGSSNPIPLT